VKARFVCGTSGYSYQHWKGVFYPPEVKPPHWLEFYADHFDAVELNVTYYNLPKRETFESWREHTPDDFRFVAKGSRLITHYHRLHDVDDAVREYFSRASGLGEKLDAVLWQLPPKMHADAERLDAFCALVNRVSAVRHVFEFRESSWLAPEIYAVLRRHGCALCIANSPTWDTAEEITADFTYLRFHGGRVLYGSEYSPEELEAWADKARKWLGRGIGVYAFFNNDAHGFAVSDAQRLRGYVLGTKKKGRLRRPVGRASDTG
jgi:uncharacterized protein YecE (DUF72 family)